MNWRLTPFFTLAAFAAGGLPVLGQAVSPAPATPAAAPADSTPSIFAVPNPGSAQPPPMLTDVSDTHGDAPRIQSGELSSAIVHSLPPYAAPTAAQKKADERQTQTQTKAPYEPGPDKPRNTIVRLPQVVVREQKPPVFTERELYTKRGLTDLAIERYIGIDPARAPNVAVANITRFLFQDGAMQQYNDDERMGAIADAKDMATAAAIGGDKAESEYIMRTSSDTYLRSFDDSDAGEGNASVAHLNDDHASWGAPVPGPR